MGLFGKKPAAAPQPGTTSTIGTVGTIAETIQQVVQSTGKPSLFAYSDFVKQVDCSRCGAPKRLPSRTAYLYCDHCGALVDYDFRMANLDTNAGITNTVFHQLIAPLKVELTRARAIGDKERYRAVHKDVFAEWLRQCPQAASPRAASDENFRERMVAYLAECTVCRDFDNSLGQLDMQTNAATAALQRIPRADGPWLVSPGIWQVAELFKRQMEQTYDLLARSGVLAMDPDEAPAGVPLRMEYSTFCQGWVPHMLPADAERLLALFGLTSEYRKVDLSGLDTRRCGGCGDELKTVPEASAVVCESCGRKLDIAGGEVPCQTCGAPLSFPVGVSRIECPYCKSGTHRL